MGYQKLRVISVCVDDVKHSMRIGFFPPEGIREVATRDENSD